MLPLHPLTLLHVGHDFTSYLALPLGCYAKCIFFQKNVTLCGTVGIGGDWCIVHGITLLQMPVQRGEGLQILCALFSSLALLAPLGKLRQVFPGLLGLLGLG